MFVQFIDDLREKSGLLQMFLSHLNDSKILLGILRMLTAVASRWEPCSHRHFVVTSYAIFSDLQAIFPDFPLYSQTFMPFSQTLMQYFSLIWLSWSNMVNASNYCETKQQNLLCSGAKIVYEHHFW